MHPSLCQCCALFRVATRSCPQLRVSAQQKRASAPSLQYCAHHSRLSDSLTIGLTRANSHQSLGKLLGNTTATVATVQSSSGLASLGFVFTDLAVDGPYSGYVLVFESSGLAWPVQPTESLPFDVQYATRS